ncbi:outer membrane protein assembly factor BamB family protein [Oerskovia enterophila]|uniref:outer membrane protein assembly factor BamB family protein n=1 Tax=Oerskovia enterophila TaxID=43678 RepID=UPI0037F5A3D5
MPFRRREQPRPITFEVVDDLDDGDDLFAPQPGGWGAPGGVPGVHGTPLPDGAARPGADVAAGSPGEGGETGAVSDPSGSDGSAHEDAPADLRARKRRRVLLAGVAAALVLVLGGLTFVDVVRARQAEALLRAVPGGVVGLERPPRELWTVDVGEAWPLAAGELFVVAAEGALVAYDRATGAEAWRRDGLGSVQCGASGGPSADALDARSVTCLGWAEAEEAAPAFTLPPSTVTVLGLDGRTMAERALDPARGNATVLSTGDLARVVRDGRDVVVLVEDARTGEVRWTQTVPTRTSDSSCMAYQEDGATVGGWDEVQLYGMDGVLMLLGCDVNASLSSDGTVLSTALTRLEQLRDGRLVRGGLTESELLDTDGTVLWSAQGELMEPLATDGTGPPLLFSRRGPGFVALDEAGGERWTFSGYATQVLLVTRDVTVISSYPGAVAVDSATGEEVWAWKDPAVGRTNGQVAAAFASRGGLTIAYSEDNGAQSRWVSIDVADGSTRWEEQVAVDAWSLFAVGGGVFGTRNGTVVAFG